MENLYIFTQLLFGNPAMFISPNIRHDGHAQAQPLLLRNSLRPIQTAGPTKEPVAMT